MNIEFLKQNGVNVEKSLELFGDIETYNETFNDYLESIDEKKNRLNNAYQTKNWYEYGVFAHAIKSDARYLGFENTQSVCYAHEIAGKEENQHFITSNYESLLVEVDKMTDIIKRYINGEQPSEETKVEETVIKSPVEPEIPVEKKLILVADDSNLICNFITKTLEDMYEVICAKNGQEVINMINDTSKNIDAILLDVNMPELNGIEVLKYIRSSSKYKNIPVSIISGDSTQETIQEVFKYNVVDMLNKPFTQKDIINVLERTLQFSNR